MRLLSLVWLLFLATSLRAAELPNVVIIYADDMGYGDLAANNPDSKIPTPNLDQLAAEGMRFTDGHSSSGICTPSRFALLTGQHHWRRFHGIVGIFGESVFKPDDFTIAKMFKSKGYNTAVVGKWHLGWNWKAIENGNPPRDSKSYNRKVKVYGPESLDWDKPIPEGPLEQGFDYYFGDGTINFPPYCFVHNDRVTEVPTIMMNTSKFKAIPEGNWEFRPGPMVEGWDPYQVLPTLTDKAVEWIGNQTTDQPFFLYFPLTAPHAPIIPNDKFRGKSEAGPYGDFVHQVDAVAGRVLQALSEGGFADSTIVVFTADNGPENYAFPRKKNYQHWSSGPLRGLKRDLWEGGHRVPFIVRWPGTVKSGTVSEETVSQVDLAATFAQVVGYELEPTDAIDSYDLLPLLQGQQYDQPLRTATVQNTQKDKYALRQGDWLYIDTTCGAVRGWEPDWYLEATGYTKETTPGLLYNLREDVGQRMNRYADYPEKVAEMKSLLARYRAGEGCAPHSKLAARQ